MQFAPSRPHPPSVRRAFSLLEVAIALAIFVFGALAVIRIFPGALQIISTGGERQNALGLNRATLARVQNASLPLAIYDTKDGTDWGFQECPQFGGVFEPRAVLNSARRGYSLPRDNQADFDRSALGSLRAVIGEGATVGVEDSGTRFALTQFPIFGDATDPTKVRVWKRDALEGVTIGADGVLDFTGARYPDGSDASNPPSGATFYVSFRYRDNAHLWGVSDSPTTQTAPVSVPDVLPLETGASATNRVVAGQVQVICAEPLGEVDADDEGDNKRGLVNLGALGVAAGDKVYLDYQADWGWIMQSGMPDAVPEQTPSGASKPRQIALGAPFIEDRATNSIYTLCQTRKAGKPSLVEAAWGENVALNGSQKLYTPTPSDLRAGRLTFETQTPVGETFVGARVAFRTRDGWAQQLSVSAASYKPYIAGQDEPWRDYVLNDSTLFFHPSEAGKSVLVTYSYSTGAGDPEITMRDRLLPLEEDPIQPGGLPPGFAPSGYAAQLQLLDTNGDVLAPGELFSISSVRGASVAVRTAWLDGSRYTQSWVSAMRAGAGAEAMQ